MLLGISFLTFALVMLSPGDPVRQMIAGNEDIMVSQAEIEALRHVFLFYFPVSGLAGACCAGEPGFFLYGQKACC